MSEIGDEADVRGHRPAPRAGVPTILDVAAAAGVSPMTVSRVLSGGKNVRPEKIQLVMDAVAQLGYLKNENARSLRPGQRTGLIGVIITNVANPYYGEVQLGIEEVVSRDGLRLLVGNSGEDAAREQALIHDFVGRQVDGLIIVPSGADISRLLTTEAAGIPLVFASRELPGFEADTVLIDDVNGAYEGTRELIAEGHRRIAYVGNMTSVFTGRRRFEGFVRAHADAGLTVDRTFVKAGKNEPEAARQAMLELLRLPEPPTAVFSANNRNTVGVLRAIIDTQADPTDLRVVGFDDFELSDIMPFPLTVIDHDARELGRTAGAMMASRLTDDQADAPSRTIQLPTRLLKK